MSPIWSSKQKMASGKRPEQNGTPESGSLSSRVMASASGLSRSAFAQPSAATATLASIPSEGSKGDSSSAATSAGEPSHHEISSQALRSSDLINKVESFRSTQSISTCGAPHSQTAFDEFVSGRGIHGFVNGEDMDVPDSSRTRMQVGLNDGINDSGKGKDNLKDAARQAAVRHHGLASNDGAAVVALLSDPGFTADEDPGDNWTAPIEDQYDLSSNEKDGTRNSSTFTGMRVSLLELLPDFTCSGVDSEQVDMQPWHDILYNYQDEVWGSSLPLVQEARQEFKDAVANGDINFENRPALRRLGMLLQHLKPPKEGR